MRQWSMAIVHQRIGTMAASGGESIVFYLIVDPLPTTAGDDVINS